MPITALPSLDRTSATFKTDLDSYFLTSLPAFSSEANALQVDVNAKQVLASAAATNAETQVTLAAAQATNAATSALAAASSAAVAGAVAWVSGLTYAVGDARYSPINMQTYRRKVAGAGTTDPSLDATNWAKAVDALPVQTGNSGKFLTTNGTAESWGAVPASALTLLATLTPTAAANVDALNVFSSTYDDYLVIASGLCPSATGNRLNIRLANGGVVDSASNYYDGMTAYAHAYTSNSSTKPSSFGLNFQTSISNVNSASAGKSLLTAASNYDTSSTGEYYTRGGPYVKTSTVSGIRFFWESGANFQATGSIKIYGYAK